MKHELSGAHSHHELLVVIAIIGILAGWLPVLSGPKQSAQGTQC